MDENSVGGLKGKCTEPGWPEYDKCPNMKMVRRDTDGEHYRCAVCEESYDLDYEEMK